MISDVVYINKDLYSSNQVTTGFVYLWSGLNYTNLHIKSFYDLINILTNKTDIYITKKF